MIVSTDPYRFVLGRQICCKPGGKWNYSGGDTQLLAGVLQRTTGKWLDEFAEEVLFKPLGIEQFEWMKMPANGEVEAASGSRLRPRDMAKIGQLVLDRNEVTWNRFEFPSPLWGGASSCERREAAGGGGRADLSRLISDSF